MASSTGYKHYSPPALNPSQYLGESGDPVKDCYILELQLFNLHKRQHLKQHPLQLNEISQPLSKKQRLNYPNKSQPPIAF